MYQFSKKSVGWGAQIFFAVDLVWNDPFTFVTTLLNHLTSVINFEMFL